MATGARATDSPVGYYSSGTWHVHNFASEDYDYGGLHSTSTNTSRLTAPTKGLYVISAQFGWDNNATGLRGLAIRKNGSDYLAYQEAPSIGSVADHWLSISCQDELDVNDYVELLVYQNSGSNLYVSSVKAITLEATLIATT